MAYDAAQMQQKGLCMVQGEERAVATKHPRNIRRPGDGAKLISSNDAANFTFRGRFIEADEACTVGYEASHKAHNALRWLIARQGYRNGEQAVVAWAVSGARVPNPCEDFFNMWGPNPPMIRRDFSFFNGLPGVRRAEDIGQRSSSRNKLARENARSGGRKVGMRGPEAHRFFLGGARFCNSLI